jgi:pseudaminic acid biosynthesis-associated methylase
MSETTDFWRGDFGDSYASRNNHPDLIKNNEALFRKALMPMFHTTPMRIIEFGANIGLNIHALRRIAPFAKCEYSAVEPNEKAAEELRKIENVNVYQTTMQDSAEDWGRGYDIAFTRGVLIHVPEVDLPRAYAALYRASRRYILIVEYFCPTPREIIYRGEPGKLWARDFCGEMMGMFPELRRVAYGFVDQYDPYPQDNVNWYLLEKTD